MRFTKKLTSALVALSTLGTLGAAQAALRVVPTYESMSVYWASPGTGADCAVQFRASGASTWTPGLDLWYDARNNECRGSLVHLTPGTTYEIQAGAKGGAMSQSTTAATWSNTVPVAKIVKLSPQAGIININESGTASGYVVYDGGGATFDAANASQFNVQVNASFVVVRNMVLKGAMQDAIRLAPTVTNVVIEDNDISNWGRTRDGTLAADMDSGVRAICSSPSLTKITIQRNKIHDPRYPSNNWSTSHPAGAQGVTFSYCGGNHVIRHNEIFSTNGNKFNDVIGGEDNFTTSGFPNVDSDIYGNYFADSWDDGIESEGGNQNVRVWGNYIDDTGTGVASTVVAIGPMYIWRNVWNRNRFLGAVGPDQDDRQPMMKAGSDSANGHGRRYVFHNTMLQPTQSGFTYSLGGGNGMGGAGIGIWNTISKNNLWNTWKSHSAFFESQADSSAERDMYPAAAGDMKMTNGIAALPKWASGSGDNSGGNGLYQLAANTPGSDQGVRIPNFNDRFNGNGPDVGAAEGGDAAMKFGLAASSGSAISGSSAAASSTSTAGSSTGTSTGTSTGSTGGSTSTTGGTTAPSATMDSSAWSFAAGTTVTYTARIIGNGATPTGKVTFTANGSGLSGCGAVALSGGTATCTTSSTPSGSVQIVGTYSGDATYAGGVAGPITVTVSGTSTSTASGSTSTGTASGSSTSTSTATNASTLPALLPGSRRKADFNGDGKSDLAWKGPSNAAGVWLMNGVTPTGSVLSTPANATVRAVADFNGDGKTDVLWRGQDGSYGISLMNGATVASSATVLAAGTDWEVIGVADFNGDGKADLLWSSRTAGLGVWLMNGASTASAAVLAAPAGFAPVLLGDFDGDGKMDIAFASSVGAVRIALMNGTAARSTTEVLGGGSGWTAIDAPDLNGDGKADLLWKYTDGSIGAWLMNGAAAMATGQLLGGNTGWSLVASADLNGDGRADLVLATADGQVGAWLMSGLAITKPALLLGGGSGWTVASAGDFNGDGKADLLWRHTSGAYGVWLMNGVATSGVAQVLGAGSGWDVAGN